MSSKILCNFIAEVMSTATFFSVITAKVKVGEKKVNNGYEMIISN